jgi:hypothetical protein
MITMPIGTLMRNARRHEMTVSRPPSTRPITDPMACMPADTAIAWFLACPTAYVVAISANPVGAATAAPTPCSARATIRVYSSVASPQTSEAMVKTPTPERNARLWPMASPTRPPSNSRPPNAST